MEQCYPLACAHLAYITQTHLPRDGATHSGLSLPSHFAQPISDNLSYTHSTQVPSSQGDLLCQGDNTNLAAHRQDLQKYTILIPAPKEVGGD